MKRRTNRLSQANDSRAPIARSIVTVAILLAVCAGCGTNLAQQRPADSGFSFAVYGDSPMELPMPLLACMTGIVQPRLKKSPRASGMTNSLDRLWRASIKGLSR
jgi:hypothetical protein